MGSHRFLFLGAGALAKECLALLHDIHPDHEIACFSDDPQRVIPQFDRCVFSREEAVSRFPPSDWAAVCCIGDPPARATVCQRFREAGYRFATLRHPQSVNYCSHLGEGAIVFPFVCLAVGATIGENVVLNFGAVVGHDTLIGDASVLTPGVKLSGRVVVGRQVLLGIGCTVLPYCRIGDRAVVAAGSSVWTDVPAGATVVGVPAVRRAIPGGRAANRAADLSV